MHLRELWEIDICFGNNRFLLRIQHLKCLDFFGLDVIALTREQSVEGDFAVECFFDSSEFRAKMHGTRVVLIREIPRLVLM